MRRGRFAVIGASVLLVGGLLGQAAPVGAATPAPTVQAPHRALSSHRATPHPGSHGSTNVRALLAAGAAPLAFDPSQSNAVLDRLGAGQKAAATKREGRNLSANSVTPPVLATDAGGPAAATPVAAAGQTESGSGGVEPADSGVAVGPDNVVEVDGQSLLFADRLGNPLEPAVPLPDFFSLPEPPDSTYTSFDADPQIHFDQVHQRWIITELSWDCATGAFTVDPTAAFGHGFIDYAISNTSDPLGTWTSAFWYWNDFIPLQANFGESTDKLALTDSLFDMGPGGSPTTPGCGSGAFEEEHPILMDWASLAAGFDGSAVPEFEFGDPDEDALQAAVGDTDLSSDLRLVGRANGLADGESEGDVIVWGFTGSVAHHTVNAAAFNATIDDSVQGFAVPPSPQQPGGALSTGIDGGPQSVYYRAGGLFVSSTYPCTPTGDTMVRDCMRVLSLTYPVISAEPVEAGDVLLATNGFDNSFGGLGISANRDLVAIYTQSSGTSDPSSFERHNVVSAPFANWSTPSSLTAGLAAYTGTTGWGSYLTVATDPQVPSAVWVGDPAAAADGSWATTIHELVVGDTGAGYVALSPTRVLDTRAGIGLSGAMVANVPRSFVVGNFNPKHLITPIIPANAVAITANLTVTGATAGGYVALSPLPSGSPTTEALTFPTGDNRANNVTIGLAPNGSLAAVYRAAAGKHADLILDVTGYFLAGSGSRYTPITPVRILDSRSGLGTTKFHANVARSFLVAGFKDKTNTVLIPADAVAVSANLTVTNQTVAGHVTVTPTQNNHPGTSTINFPLKDNRANGLTIPIDPLTGKIWAVFTAKSGTLDLTMDVTGYYSAAPSGLLFHPLDPGRRVDTRVALGTGGFGNGLTGVQGTTPRSAVIAGHLGVPAAAAAITGDLTITGQTALGHVTITPDSEASPITSTLNFPLGDTRSNGVTVPLGTGAVWFVYQGASGKHVQVILDLTGYFE